MHRREFLRSAAACTAGLFTPDSLAVLEPLFAQPLCANDQPAGELIGFVPLEGTGRKTPFGQVVGGDGLDARLFTDLSRIQPDRLITPSAEVFVRTTAPPALRETPQRWSIPLQGFTGGRSVEIEELRRQARNMGPHLIECAGNTDPDNFGLMSVAEWEGVPLANVLATAGIPSGADAVVVSGVDDVATPSRSSNAGASWVLPVSAVERRGAFLAVGMNGAPLPPDHGAPVRLVVPGWYGCSWIKWVNDIRVAATDEPSTLQMLEFSRRTHQNGLPAVARDYEPPVIDLAATPIRVEKRRVGGRLEYRIVGIVWGGDRVVDRLTIRFKAGEPPVPFPLCPAPKTHVMWSLWEYRWRPAEPGIYHIVLGAADPAIRTRRLDISFYIRRVVIDEV
jgi:DMSO/TMAO reductase YedYZ molybdopterin-dependent catalytic subunit